MTTDEKATADLIIQGAGIIGKAFFTLKKPEMAIALGLLMEMILNSWATDEVQEYYLSKLAEKASPEAFREAMKDFPRDDYSDFHEMLEELK